MYDKASIALIPSGTKTGKLYSVLPANDDGDFIFERGTTATRVNKDGLIESVSADIPRLDYPLTNGVVGDCPHLLLEPSRTNIITYSEDFSDSSWTINGATITSNSIISPNGALNATKLVENNSNSQHKIQETSNPITAGNVVYSQFLKKGERNKVLLELGGGGGGSAKFDLDLGVVISQSTVNATITRFSDNWYRCSVSFTSTSSSVYLGTYILDDTETLSYQGDGSSGVYIWGAQLEQGSYATSYIPTIGLAVTRIGDVCYNSGTSSEFNDSEGVLFAEIEALANDTTFRQMSINGGTTNTVRILYGTTSNQIRAFLQVNSSTKADISYISNDITENTKIAFKYKENDFALWVNGVERGTDTNGSVFTNGTLDTFDFNDNGSGGSPFYGKVKQLIYFNEALSDSELQTLTS